MLRKLARAGVGYNCPIKWRVFALSSHSKRCAATAARIEPVDANLDHAKTDDDDRIVKPFQQIEQEMRLRSRHKNSVSPNVHLELKRLLKSRRLSPQLMSPGALTDQINVGDLLLVNLSPVIVVKLPQEPDGKVVVASADGACNEISVSFVDARLGNFVPPSLPFVGPDGHVGPATHAILASALRRFYVVATELTATYLEPARALLLNIGVSSRSKATTLPFTEFVKSVTGKPQPAEVEFYAVRLCLEHYTLVNRWLMDFQYSGRYALTVVPTEMERQHLAMITLPDVLSAPDQAKVTYLKDYAAHNLPGAEAESCALEILRNMDEAKSFTTFGPEEAAAVVFEGAEQWPGLARMRYDWFTKAEPPSPVSATEDALATVRKSFTDVPVFCIDPEDVREVDDGISWSSDSNGRGTLGIHIADPTSFLSHDELVERVSKTPATAHFEDFYFPFLPKSITDRMQLAPGRPCMSVMVKVDLKRGEIGKPYLAAHLLGNNVIAKPYNVVDKELEAPKQNEFKELLQVTRLLKQTRGGFEVESTPLGPAAGMVAECMIYAGKAVAQMCASAGIPIPFRSQKVHFWNADGKNEFETLSKAGSIGFKWRGAIRKSQVSLSPDDGHYGLGVDAYTRFTSPLRRGEDVLVHMQASQALLLGNTPKLSSDDIAGLLPWIQLGTELIKESQRGSQRFKILTSLRVSDQSYKGIVADLDDRTGFVSSIWLPDQGVMGRPDRSDIDLSIDDVAWFKIKEVNAVSSTLVVELV